VPVKPVRCEGPRTLSREKTYGAIPGPGFRLPQPTDWAATPPPSSSLISHLDRKLRACDLVRRLQFTRRFDVGWTAVAGTAPLVHHEEDGIGRVPVQFEESTRQDPEHRSEMASKASSGAATGDQFSSSKAGLQGAARPQAILSTWFSRKPGARATLPKIGASKAVEHLGGRTIGFKCGSRSAADWDPHSRGNFLPVAPGREERQNKGKTFSGVSTNNRWPFQQSELKKPKPPNPPNRLQKARDTQCLAASGRRGTPSFIESPPRRPPGKAEGSEADPLSGTRFRPGDTGYFAARKSPRKKPSKHLAPAMANPLEVFLHGRSYFPPRGGKFPLTCEGGSVRGGLGIRCGRARADRHRGAQQACADDPPELSPKRVCWAVRDLRPVQTKARSLCRLRGSFRIPPFISLQNRRYFFTRGMGAAISRFFDSESVGAPNLCRKKGTRRRPRPRVVSSRGNPTRKMGLPGQPEPFEAPFRANFKGPTRKALRFRPSPAETGRKKKAATARHPRRRASACPDFVILPSDAPGRYRRKGFYAKMRRARDSSGDPGKHPVCGEGG